MEEQRAVGEVVDDDGNGAVRIQGGRGDEAVARGNSAELEITADGIAAIKDLAKQAAGKVPQDREDEAIRNAGRLGGALVSEARRAQDRMVTRAVLASALRSLCPLWPFC